MEEYTTGHLLGMRYRSIEAPFDGKTGVLTVCLASCLICLGFGQKDIEYALLTVLDTDLLFTYTFYNVIDSSYLLCDCTPYLSHLHRSSLVSPWVLWFKCVAVGIGLHPITAGLSRAISALLVTQTRISSAWWVLFAGLVDVPAFSFSFISHHFSFYHYFFSLSFILLFLSL